MKHFLPSSVMLTPFVVKYYPEPDEEIADTDEVNEVKSEHREDDKSE
ncbi:hypothetical protein ACQEXU_03405 [Vibrio sp. TRT 21S02]